jgi:hypothetical protein
VVRYSGSCQKARFELAENELSLWTQCGNTSGVIGMEMCEKYCPRVNVQTRELRRKILALPLQKYRADVLAHRSSL